MVLPWNITFFLVNFTIVIIALMAIYGGYDRLQNNGDNDRDLDNSLSNFNPWLAITFGLTAVLFAISGCCGYLIKSKFLYSIYWVGVVSMTSYYFVNVIGILIARQNAEIDARSEMEDQMKQYSQNDEVKSAVDYFQRKFHCCGIDGHNDWDKYLDYVPASCCGKKIFQRFCNQSEVNDLDGCSEALKAERLEQYPINWFWTTMLSLTFISILATVTFTWLTL